MIQIIPAIDIIDGKCVRLCQGDYERKSVYTVSPSDMVKRFADAGLFRIHAVDLDGAKNGEPVNLRTLEVMASAANGVEIEWGGRTHVSPCLGTGARCRTSLRCCRQSRSS